MPTIMIRLLLKLLVLLMMTISVITFFMMSSSLVVAAIVVTGPPVPETWEYVQTAGLSVLLFLVSWFLFRLSFAAMQRWGGEAASQKCQKVPREKLLR